MREIKLSARLMTCAEYVRRDKAVCDVGTDHALLPCYLYSTGVKSITASDIADGPLLSAKATAQKYFGDNCPIRLVKSDGLRNIEFAEDVIIAGMGGELIADILDGCTFLSDDTRFILQPMTKANILRRRLYKSGFEIISEKAVTDAGKLYTVIYAKHTGVSREISDSFSYTGKNYDTNYRLKQAEILSKAAVGCEKSDSERSKRLKAAAIEIISDTNKD